MQYCTFESYAHAQPAIILCSIATHAACRPPFDTVISVQAPLLLQSYCTALKSLSAANWFEHLCPLADNIIISFLLTPDVITQSNVITKRATFCDLISSYAFQSLANLQWLHRIGARIIL